MELNEYQEKAMQTCMPTSDNFSYMMLNLIGEVGELSSKVAKSIRKGNAGINNNKIEYFGEYISYNEDTKDDRRMTIDVMLEAGDVLWQLAGLCKVLGWTLEEVAQANLHKLSSRKQRGVIDGNGDNR